MPYRGQPRYNSKRRLTWSRTALSRKNSASDYGTVRRMSSCSTGDVSSLNNSPALGVHQTASAAELRPAALMQAVRKSMSETNELKSIYSNNILPGCASG